MDRQHTAYLLETIYFKNYDNDLSNYVDLVRELVNKYDYESVCSALLTFVAQKKNLDIHDRLGTFKRYISITKFEPKRTEIDQMSHEKQKNEQLLKERKKIGKNKSKVIRQKPYDLYTWEYLYQKSVEYSMSVSLICEKKGLVLQWLVY